LHPIWDAAVIRRCEASYYASSAAQIAHDDVPRR